MSETATLEAPKKPTLVEPEEEQDTAHSDSGRLKHSEITDGVIADEFLADATDEIAPLVQETVDKFHPHLGQMRIRYVYDLAEKPKVSGGKVVYAQTSKASGLLRLYAQSDFIIKIHAATWTSLSPAKKFALIDHELMHCGVEEGKPVIIGHDVEEFGSIIERHGLWSKSSLSFAKAIQMELEFMKGEVKERK